MKPIQEDFSKIVEQVRIALGMSNIKFYCSTPAEFIGILKATKADASKYPFVFLNSTDIRYTEENNICSIGDIVIANSSRPDFTATEREEKSMKPVLKPILEEMLKRLKVNRNIKLHKEGDIIVHYFYGKTGIVGYESGIYPDHVDAIQLKNFDFRYYECKK